MHSRQRTDSRRKLPSFAWWVRIAGWLLASLIGLSSLASAASAIRIDESFRGINLAEHVDLLEDGTRITDPVMLMASPLAESFSPIRRGALERIDPDTVYWLRFALANTGDRTRVLLLLTSPTQPTERAAYDVTSGHPAALPESRIDRLRTVLELTVPPQSQRLYLLRVQGAALHSAQVELQTLAHYVDRSQQQIWLNGFGQGGLLILALSALAILGLYREATYLWLAAHTIAFHLFFLTLYEKFSVSWLPESIDDALLPSLPTALLLFVSLCSLLLALRLPVAVNGTATLTHRSLLALVAVTAALIPATLLASTPVIATVAVGLVSANAVATVAIALYAFLASSQRYLLLYALIRMIVLVAVFSGLLIGDTQILTGLFVDALPLAVLCEGICLLALLLWRSRLHIRRDARSDRDIAILEAEGRSRTEAIAEVGHRMRTPISGVLGMLDMVQDTPLSAVQLDYLHTIRRASNELLNVVDEMSDLSRLQTQPSALQQAVFDPHGLVAECVDGFRSLAAAHRLELINDPAPALPAFVSGDPTRLRQLLLQLLHREIGAHEGGEIVVRIEPITQRNWLRFHFETLASDGQSTPSGIDRRLHAPGSAHVRTAVARQLIEQLGGRFGQRVLDDQHTELWFDLPLPVAARSAVALDQPSLLQNKQLLVIDDSPTFCEVLRRQTSHWGMTVHTAATTHEGLARLRTQLTLGDPIDVLLIDTDMPELQSGEWFERLREVQPQPLILLLSSQADTLEPHPRGIDVRRVLLKPVNHNGLKITLIEEFKRRAQLTATRAAIDDKPIRCLYAEDNAINAKVLAGMLTKLGVDAVGVGNGQEAVEAIQRAKFDIVLMDCDMPVMDGWEASERIREIFRNRGMPAVPIIALTANTVEELGERARQPLMDAHLVKPIHLQELRALLENWTGKIIATETIATEKLSHPNNVKR